MRKAAVILARAIGFVETADLLSGTKQSIPDAVALIAEHYSFEKFPQTREERTSKEGLLFYDGFSKLGPINKLTIFNNGIVLDTNIDTSTSLAMIEEMLEWGRTELHLNYHPGMLKRTGYLSDLSFFSDPRILTPHVALTNLAKATSDAVSGIWQESVQYAGLTVQVGLDPLTRKFPISPFIITRRAEEPFSENKFFSEAPLPTDLHWAFLEQYEKDALSNEG